MLLTWRQAHLSLRLHQKYVRLKREAGEAVSFLVRVKMVRSGPLWFRSWSLGPGAGAGAGARSGARTKHLSKGNDIKPPTLFMPLIFLGRVARRDLRHKATFGKGPFYTYASSACLCNLVVASAAAAAAAAFFILYFAKVGLARQGSSGKTQATNGKELEGVRQAAKQGGGGGGGGDQSLQ
ncbi:hypothetical protein CDD81_1095 [Ophiocordyceps australis]|uniref:Uncharacterized protein n=1 Tax=Ophiocordyceps australis TaxID=1399860 RepID=A0A2C5XFL4_9HYPO|nr:hypothetical protein CDD81_1095 [Ophiocordyceps australis]